MAETWDERLLAVPMVAIVAAMVCRDRAINAVAEALDVSPRTVRRWIANGDLIATRVYGVVRISEDDLRVALHREA
jgi:excisionase family DNA binding protein